MTEKIGLSQTMFSKLNGNNYCLLNTNVLGRSYIKFKIVGYVKNSDCFLIGKLKGNLGITEHFKNPISSDIIPTHVRGNNYYYISVRFLDNPKYKKTKLVKIKKDKLKNVLELENKKVSLHSNIKDISIEDLEF